MAVVEESAKFAKIFPLQNFALYSIIMETITMNFIRRPVMYCQKPFAMVTNTFVIKTVQNPAFVTVPYV